MLATEVRQQSMNIDNVDDEAVDENAEKEQRHAESANSSIRITRKPARSNVPISDRYNIEPSRLFPIDPCIFDSKVIRINLKTKRELLNYRRNRSRTTNSCRACTITASN